MVSSTPRNVTSHFGFPRNVSGENMASPLEVQKQPKLKVIIHDFEISRGPRFECHRMPPRDMAGHCKGIMLLGTNMWMALRLF